LTIYTDEFEERIIEWVRKRESVKRFAHTERVVATVTILAERWAPDDVMTCRLAGWIHDAAKSYSDSKMLQAAQKYRIPIGPIEWEKPMLLHGAVAYHRAAKKFDLNDERIKTACTHHTTGHPDMNLTDKLLFLADLTEPERNFPLVAHIRDLAMIDIDKALLLAVDGTLRYLLSSKRIIDPRLLLLYNQLVRQLDDLL
jgi:predicted HD superfamily hydrolase involved in NAD metabolism